MFYKNDDGCIRTGFHCRQMQPMCDQIGRFLKVSDDIFSCKSSPIHRRLFGNFEKINFQVKTAVTFFGNFCLLFISASGHTGDHSAQQFRKPITLYLRHCVRRDVDNEKVSAPKTT